MQFRNCSSGICSVPDCCLHLYYYLKISSCSSSNVCNVDGNEATSSSNVFDWRPKLNIENKVYPQLLICIINLSWKRRLKSPQISILDYQPRVYVKPKSCTSQQRFEFTTFLKSQPGADARETLSKIEEWSACE